MKTTILLDHGPVEGGNWVVRALLRVAGEAQAGRLRVPLNLSLVLDRSGSMGGPKLPAARQAACGLVQRLAPEDTVSVVAFDGVIETVSGARAVGDANELIGQIRSIEPRGSTNLSGGWLQGSELTAGARTERSLNRVLLLTDGRANAGITDRGQLTGMVANARERGVTTTTIGFGADYDEVLLRLLADAGGGNAYYIETPDQAADVFAHEVEGLLGVAAQNVSVTIQIEEAEFIGIRHAYPSVRNGNRIELQLGDLYASAPKNVLFEMLVRRPPADGNLLLANLAVRGTVVNADGSIEVRTIDLPITLSLAAGPHVEPAVRREALLLEAARVREEARRAQARGDIAEAIDLLRAGAQKLSVSEFQDAEIKEDVQDLMALADLWTSSQVSPLDAKYAYQRAQDALRGERSKSDLIGRLKGKGK